MTYKSPIEIISEKVTESLENGVMKAVYKAEFQVDKYELYKALQYDRGQYEKGYADRDHEIVRCKDCKFNYGNANGVSSNSQDIICTYFETDGMTNDDYCSRGESEE